jgi:hypothetical protein
MGWTRHNAHNEPKESHRKGRAGENPPAVEKGANTPTNHCSEIKRGKAPTECGMNLRFVPMRRVSKTLRIVGRCARVIKNRVSGIQTYSDISKVCNNLVSNVFYYSTPTGT